MNESDSESEVKKPKLMDPQGIPVLNSQDRNQNTEIHQNASNIKEQEETGSITMMVVDYSQDEEDIKVITELRNPDHQGFEILSSERIFENMIEIVNSAKEIISDLPTACLMTLLNHVKWNKDRLVENYFDNQEKFLKDAKVIVPADIEMSTVDPEPPTSPLDLIDCAICYDSVQFDQTSAMPCSHRFCKSCWKLYIHSEIMNKGESQMITCPETGCAIFVGHEMIKLLVQDQPIVLQKYQQLISSHFVEANPRLCWCPSAGCENAVVVEEVCWRRAGITCSCGHNFCFLCSNDWHEPVKCDYLARWLKKCRSDSGTCTWIQTNTKDCPKCKTMIEKNGGCNHMTCRSKACRYEFCWVCMGDWKSHTGNAYACNKFVEGDADGEVSEFRASLKRYTHYFERFVAHEESLKFESKLKDTVRDKMIVFQKDWQMSWVDVQFFEIAARTLCKCRKTLQYTYVFAYFLEKTNQQEIFENNQRDLESATEILSGYLENDLRPEGSNEKVDVDTLGIKLKIVNSSAYCEARRVVLIGHVQDGYDEDFWTYRTVANS